MRNPMEDHSNSQEKSKSFFDELASYLQDTAQDVVEGWRSVRDSEDTPVLDAKYEPWTEDNEEFDKLCAQYNDVYAQVNADYKTIRHWQDQASLRLKKLELISRSDTIQRSYYQSNGICDLLIRLENHYENLGEGERISPGVVHTLLEMMSFELRKLQKLPSEEELESKNKPRPEGYQKFEGEFDSLRTLMQQYSQAEDQKSVLQQMRQLLATCKRKAANNREVAKNLPPVVIPTKDTSSTDALLDRLMELYRIGNFEDLQKAGQDEPDLLETDTTARQVLAYARTHILSCWKPLED